MLFPLLKWLHVLSAIVAVGANATYGVWLARASRDPQSLPFALSGVKIIDDRIANPAYGLLLITGLLMVYVARLYLTTPWLLTALILYAVMILVGLFGYTPTLKNQISLVESHGSESSEYQGMARRGMILGIVVAVLAIAIIFLMVVKPPLWS
jgi:uncharacterized membrane protein